MCDFAMARRGPPTTSRTCITLSCAAGYADLVVGERRTISDLRGAREVPRGACLAARLPDAVAILADMRANAV
jgi:hypothetical protein